MTEGHHSRASGVGWGSSTSIVLRGNGIYFTRDNDAASSIHEVFRQAIAVGTVDVRAGSRSWESKDEKSSSHVLRPKSLTERVPRGLILVQVDMATYGRDSWALTSLGVWRDQSLHGTEKSAEFVKSKQREARRTMLSLSNSMKSRPPLLRGNTSNCESTMDTKDSSLSKVDTRSLDKQCAISDPRRESIGNSISDDESGRLLEASSAGGGTCFVTQDAPADMAVEEMES